MGGETISAQSSGSYEWNVRDRTILASLLPRTAHEMERAYAMGTDQYRLLPPPASPSFCPDHLREGKSTIPGAGKGAFATRQFKKGSIVTVAPLLYIPNKESAMAVRNGDTNNTVQLLENYCFGHRYANLLLCPTTHAALINHQSSSNDGKANVKLRWAQELNAPSSSSIVSDQPLDMVEFLIGNLSEGILDVDPYTLSSFAATRLAFEYVAIEEIQTGDEIILDYGDQYEQALQQHKARNAQHAKDMKGDGLLTPYILNKEERAILLSTDPFINEGKYAYECNVHPNLNILTNFRRDSWENFWSDRMVDRSNWPNEISAMYGSNDFAGWYPCRVVNIKEGESYDVEVYTKGSMRSGLIRLLKNCPRDRIRFAWAPYQSSQHLPWAFRQYLPIPDDLFPMRWRSDYKPRDVWKLGRVSESTKEVDYEEVVRNATCGLYLAESNIPNAGFGFYTAVDIPSADLVIGSSHASIILYYQQSSGQKWPFKDYVWSGNVYGLSGDGAPEYETQFISGLLGGLANFHTGLVNTYFKSDSVQPKLDRRVDSGAGAFSDVADAGTASLHPVGAGEELFLR